MRSWSCSLAVRDNCVNAVQVSHVLQSQAMRKSNIALFLSKYAMDRSASHTETNLKNINNSILLSMFRQKQIQ